MDRTRIIWLPREREGEISGIPRDFFKMVLSQDAIQMAMVRTFKIRHHGDSVDSVFGVIWLFLPPFVHGREMLRKGLSHARVKL